MRGCRGPAPARGSTVSGSGSGGSRSAAAAPGSITPLDVVADPHSGKAAAVTWKPKPLAGTHAHPSRCLLSTLQCPRLGQQPCGALTPCSGDLEAVFRSLGTRRAPSSTKAEPVRRSVHRSPTNWSRPSAGASPNTERTPVGPLCVVSSKASTGSPPPSAERMRRTLHVRKPPQCRATTTQNLHRSRSRPRPRRCHQIDRLNTLTVGRATRQIIPR